ncbi:hypothetical protein BCD67_25930 [Oscillatoriales cyanobacterium USR001]|nr:hypothetical protein BCD67_25930 [Oscillatoriales cyanobacterium USR001]
MRVIIYVEGSSDKNAMEVLLESLIAEKLQQGISIEFFPIKGGNNDRGGDAKKELLLNAPTKAVNILCNNPDSIAIILPDLYPQNKGFTHETFQDLEKGIMDKFYQALQKRGIQDERLKERFKIFCFKYEMEALILAAESALQTQLGVTSLTVTWKIPVEDQNHNSPPCQIVEKLCLRRNLWPNNRRSHPFSRHRIIY